MQAPIQPLHRLPLNDLAPQGVHSIAMNPVAPTVYVHVHQQHVDPLAAALAYWPWILTPLAALLLLLVTWRTLRITSRPQRKGVPHCRRCNYDLSGAIAATATAPLSLGALTKGEGRGEGSTPPASPTLPSSALSSSSSSSSSCPECGRALTARNILTGRSTRRRLAPLALPAALLLALAALAVALASGARPSLRSWPSPTADRLAHALGIVVPSRFYADCSTIVEVDLESGATLRTLAPPRPRFFHDFAVDPTGASMIIGGDRRSLLWISTSSGRVLQRLDFAVPTAPGSMVSIDDPVCGFSPDGAAAFIHAPTDSADATAVRRWARADGSTTHFADITTHLRSDTRGRWARQVTCLPGTLPRVLSRPHFMEAFPTRSFRLDIHTAPGDPDGSANLGASIDPSTALAITADGARAYLTGGMMRQLIAVDLANLQNLGAVTLPDRVTGHNVAVDGDNRLVAVGGFGGVALRDTAARTWAAILQMPSDLYGGSATFSHNARFVASRAQWGSGGAFRHELLIWDLAPLRTKLPPAPGN